MKQISDSDYNDLMTAIPVLRAVISSHIGFTRLSASETNQIGKILRFYKKKSKCITRQ